MARKASNWTSAPISALNLTTRSHNALTRASRIETVGQLASKSDDQLRWLPGMGDVSLRECREAVRQFITDCDEFGEEALALNDALKLAGCEVPPADVARVVSNLASAGWALQRN